MIVDGMSLRFQGRRITFDQRPQLRSELGNLGMGKLRRRVYTRLVSWTRLSLKSAGVKHVEAGASVVNM